MSRILRPPDEAFHQLSGIALCAAATLNHKNLFSAFHFFPLPAVSGGFQILYEKRFLPYRPFHFP